VKHDRLLCFPVLPRCSTYFGVRCTAPAVALIYTPDDRPVPGGYVCAPCGVDALAEYHAVGETWTLRTIHRYDPAVCAPPPEAPDAVAG